MIENVLIEPEREEYPNLTSRPKKDVSQVEALIKEIYEQVVEFGDIALVELTERFDKCRVENLCVSVEEVENASVLLSSDLKEAIKVAKRNIEKFHKAQISKPLSVQISTGIECMQRSIAIERVGIYIPGGTAPLFSTVLMLAVPAILAGCQEIILCSPPNSEGNIHPAILWTAQLCGVSKIFKIGGAQAIAAMSLGTDIVPKVNKVFGPGNQYVTAAKVYAQKYGVAMDMPAGPSELLVYGDLTCVPKFVAADLLSQAEHGIDSQVILVASNAEIVDKVKKELIVQIADLPRKNIAKEALKNSKAIVIHNKNGAFDFINEYAPEHLIIASEDAPEYIPMIINAGSVFLGNYCPESAGDYASGTNHTLPTDGWSKSYNGVNVDSFSRKVTFQSITKKGIQELGDSIITMAENEQLQAHANAVKVRLLNLKNEMV
ncbi:MAG: histidinol dehydrogenase [Saprospiraceae bacterium]|jgi:histidinol dehydrogenase